MKPAEETELIRLKNRYARYFDAGRIDDFVALFMPDAVLDLSEMGSAKGESAIRALIVEVMAGISVPGTRMHLVSTPLFETMEDDQSRGDQAATAEGNQTPEYCELTHRVRGSWYLQVFRLTPSPPELATIGRYDEEYSRGEHGWRFSRVRLTYMRLDVVSRDVV